MSATGIKPNNETVLVYSPPLYNLEKNKSFSMDNSIGWTLSVLLTWGYSIHTREEVQMENTTKETLMHSGNLVKLHL